MLRIGDEVDDAELTEPKLGGLLAEEVDAAGGNCMRREKHGAVAWEAVGSSNNLGEAGDRLVDKETACSRKLLRH